MTNTAPVPLDDDGPVAYAAWRVLEHYAAKADDDALDSVLERMPVALRDFDALAGETVNVGILYENSDDLAQAFGYQRTICLPPDRPISNVTLWHELGHVAIRVRYEDGDDVAKTSEEFCSIFSVARMPPAAIDEDRIPYLGEPAVDAAEWPSICRDVLEYRAERGPHSHYVKEAETRLGIHE